MEPEAGGVVLPVGEGGEEVDELGDDGLGRRAVERHRRRGEGGRAGCRAPDC